MSFMANVRSAFLSASCAMRRYCSSLWYSFDPNVSCFGMIVLMDVSPR